MTTHDDAVKAAKEFRVELDGVLQKMKLHKQRASENSGHDMQADDFWEWVAQHTISMRDLESAIMRQGMALKAIGNPNPYPNSYNPASKVVDPTADGLKL